MALVSVVIPVRNGAGTIAVQLEALTEQDHPGPWELVIADNESMDGTRKAIEPFRERFPALRVVEARGGRGINFARNAGVRAAEGDVILICDADDRVHPGWISGHVAALHEFDITGGPLDHVALNPEDVAALHSTQKQEACPVTGRFLPYATGCNFGFRREVWESLGGFDDEWQRGHTETEFCWRAQLAGFQLGWAPRARVAYRRAPTLRSELRRLFRSARALPRLYRAFRDAGMPGKRLRSGVRAWLWLLYRAPWALSSRTWRLKWLQVAFWRAGLVAGSVRYRVFYL